MLSKKDLSNIRTIIQEELKDALTIGIKHDKFDKNTGIKEVIIKEFHLTVWLADQFPYLVGALRGMQSDTNKANNRMISTADSVKALNKIMIDNENALKCIAALNDKVKEIDQEDILTIESNDP